MDTFTGLEELFLYRKTGSSDFFFSFLFLASCPIRSDLVGLQ